MLSDQDRNIEKAYEDLRRLSQASQESPDALISAIDVLDASLAQLHSINEDLNEKNLELAVLHAKYRELFDLAPDSFLVTDAQGMILEANPSCADLIKKNLNYIIGKPIAIFVAESDTRDFLSRQGRLAESSDANAWEMKIGSRDSSYRTVACRVVVCPARGDQPATLLWLLHDITERAQLERRLAGLNMELEKRVQNRTSQLAKAHSDLRYLTSKLVSIQEEERKRISRELHDEAGQGLIALRMSLESIRQDVPAEQAELRTRLIDAGELAFNTVERLRILAQDLRPPAVELVDLDSLLSQLCHEVSNRSKLPIAYSGTSLPPLDAAIKISLYRILQEALSNVVRHSQATRASVSLKLDDHQAVLSVTDNGVGFDTSRVFANPDHTGIGLIGMKERVELLGGHFELESVSEQGTRLAAFVPLIESPESPA